MIGSSRPTRKIQATAPTAATAPTKTFLKAARARGCRAMNGLGMVAYQGARAFELFTGRPADGERILRYLTELAGR